MAYELLDTALIDLQYNDPEAFQRLLAEIEDEQPLRVVHVEERDLLAPRPRSYGRVTGKRLVVAL